MHVFFSHMKNHNIHVVNGSWHASVHGCVRLPYQVNACMPKLQLSVGNRFEPILLVACDTCNRYNILQQLVILSPYSV